MLNVKIVAMSKREEILQKLKEGKLTVKEADKELLFLHSVSISEDCENDMFSKSALKVQKTWQMGGLANCIYEEYARSCFREYFNELQRIYH